MKPFRISLFLISVLLFYTLLIILFPKKNLEYGILDSLFLSSDYNKQIALDSLINIIINTEFSQIDFQKDKIKLITAVAKQKKSTNSKNRQKKTDHKIRTVFTPLEFPKGQENILNNFFSNLSDLKNNNEKVRILHFGDSQIEGDRITEYFRHMFQVQFGGKGIGLVPFQLYCRSVSVEINTSDNWVQYSNFGNVTQYINKYNYGLLGTMLSFQNNQPFTSENYNTTAWLKLKCSPLIYDNAQKFDEIKIFVDAKDKGFGIKLYNKSKLLINDYVPPNPELSILKWKFSSTPDDLLLKVTSAQSPNFYALSLDGTRGVQVDNIPMRGAWGPNLHINNIRLIASMLNELKPKLIIFQFGINVVPNIVKDYKYYENRLVKQINTLKRISPEVNIIIMGISDIARKQNGQYKSFPNVEKIIEAQKNAAFQTGSVFWNTYKSMGGKNSMSKWVHSSPPLAQKDFIHFNYKGGEIIANLFYRAIMKSYNEYIKDK